MKKKPISLIDILVGSFFILLLVGFTVVPFQIRSEFRAFLIIFSISTAMATFKRNKPAKLMFSILLGILLFANFYFVTNLIIKHFNPYDGWVIINGQEEQVGVRNWVYEVILSSVFTLIFVFCYRIFVKRNKTVEMSYSLLFFILLIFLSFVPNFNNEPVESGVRFKINPVVPGYPPQGTVPPLVPKAH